MATVGTKAGGFCFRCSAPDPRLDLPPLSVYTPWPMLAPVNGLEYTRANPLIRAVYAPGDLRGMVAVREERKHNPRPLMEATQADLDAFRNWLILIHEAIHLYDLEWTPAKELARLYLALSYEPIADLMTADRLLDRDVVEAWRSLEFWTNPLAEIEKRVAFVEEVVATAIALHTMARQTETGGEWAGFGEELERAKRELLAAEEEQFKEPGEEQFMGFGEALARFEPLAQFMIGDAEFRAFIIPLLQPAQVVQRDANAPPLARDGRANLETILALTRGCDSAASAAAQLRALDDELTTDWTLALGVQIAYARDEKRREGDRSPFGARIAQMLWHVGRGDFVAGTTNEAAAEAVRSAAAFRARIAASSRLGLANLVLLQPRRRQRRLAMNVGWWVDDEDAIPEHVQESHLATVVLEGLREQLLSGQGIVCPKNPEGTSRCDCPLAWRRAMLRLAKLAQSDAFGPGEWSPLPCRRR